MEVERGLAASTAKLGGGPPAGCRRLRLGSDEPVPTTME